VKTRMIRLIPLLALLASLGCVPAAAPHPRGSSSPAGEDDGYVILLRTTSGADHVQRASRLKQSLTDRGWRKVFCINKAGHSEVFRGPYRSIPDAGDDLAEAKKTLDDMGQRLFARALIVPLPGRPVGPPEWNILNTDAVYTVQMATYYDVPEKNYYGRKQSVVDLCRKFRDMGYDAYYYHGPVRSHVTIGRFGEEAIRVVRDGDKMHLEKLDPRIDQIIEAFPQHNINGNAHVVFVHEPKPGTHLAQRKRVVIKPFPVRVPREKAPDAKPSNDNSGDWEPW
jgi:hypothetical protein